MPYRTLSPEEVHPLIRILALVAREVLNSPEAMEWLWHHTKSPEHYDTIVDALRLLSGLDQYVEWVSEAGAETEKRVLTL